MPILPRHVIIDDTVLTHYDNSMGIICDHVRSHDKLARLGTDRIKSHALANWIMWSVGMQRSCGITCDHVRHDHVEIMQPCGSHVIMWDHMWSCGIMWDHMLSCGITCDHVEIMWKSRDHVSCDHVSRVIMWKSSESHMIMWVTCDHVSRDHVEIMWKSCDHVRSHVIMWDCMYLHVGSCDHMLWVIQSLIQSHESTIMWDHMWHAQLCNRVRPYIKSHDHGLTCDMHSWHVIMWDHMSRPVSFPGPSPACGVEKQGEPGIYSHAGWHNWKTVNTEHTQLSVWTTVTR